MQFNDLPTLPGNIAGFRRKMGLIWPNSGTQILIKGFETWFKDSTTFSTPG
jgi:hypothetical protein